MKWVYTIGRIGGTEVKVHLTFLLFLVWWAVTGYQQDGASGALAAAFWLLAVFGCILLHEFGHIFTARRFGVRTPDVILLPIGGVARLERIPEEPRQELLIAIAGPAVTAIIALVLYVIIRLSGNDAGLGDLSPSRPFLSLLMNVNVYLLLFNLIPAFPMDGGRVLRAVLASRMGLVRGTRVAATLGQVLAGVGGLYAITIGHPLAVLVAFFVFLGASAEAEAVETRAAGDGLQVSQMMVTDFRTIPVYATLAEAVDLLLSGEQREFPVVDNNGRIEGILTRDNLIRGLSKAGPGGLITDAMTPEVPIVGPTLGFQEALERLRSSRLPALPVVDPTGGLIGLLTSDNITDLLLVQRARPDRDAGIRQRP
ncbi:MAG TPA: site-2 protease family protein [Gemmatimonadales bacterium]|nr:site-2 protease family protein [Gemmatimonadales bacterium]